jgi:hypothetical protein
MGMKIKIEIIFDLKNTGPILRQLYMTLLQKGLDKRGQKLI